MRRPSRAALVLVAAGVVSACGPAEPISQATSLLMSPSPPAATPAAATPAATPEPSPTAAAPDAPPPKPGDPTFELLDRTTNADGTSRETYRITWTAPEGAATEFLVYGLTECLRYSQKYDGRPCVVRGMRIAKEDLVLLATAPGDAREATVSWDAGEIDIPPWAAILMRAVNAAGDSIFTIVHSEIVCFQCTY